MTLHRFFERLIWLCMLPLVILGVVLVTTQLRSMDEHRGFAEQALARAAARAMEQMLEVRLASLELLAQIIRDEASDPQERLIQAKAHALALHYREVQGADVVIGGAAGHVVVNTRIPLGESLPALPSIQGHAALAAALASGSRVVGDAFFGPVARKELVALAVPLLLRHPEHLAVMSTVPTAELQQRLQQYDLPKAWSLTLRDSSGRPLAHVGAPMEEPRLPNADRQGDLGVQVRLAQAPWTINLHTPPTTLLDSPGRQASLLVAALGLTVVLAYWSGRLASRRLKHSLASLIQRENEPSREEDIEEVREVRLQMLGLQRERQGAEERERQRIGLELHDDLQQRLALLRNDVERMQRGHTQATPAAAEVSPGILQRIDETIAATRHLVNDLRPQVLDDFGVAEGLRLLTQRMRESHGLNIDLQLMAEERAEQLPKPVATALYRVTQEALNNVRKHAQASVVHVTLDLRAPDAAELEIVDDGVGFEVLSSETPESHGLRGMLERVQALRGSLKIESQPGEGTAILVRLPIVPIAPVAAGDTPGGPAPAPTPAPTSDATPAPASAPASDATPAPTAATTATAPPAPTNTPPESPKTRHSEF